jgi:hypothetical protein
MGRNGFSDDVALGPSFALTAGMGISDCGWFRVGSLSTAPEPTMGGRATDIEDTEEFPAAPDSIVALLLSADSALALCWNGLAGTCARSLTVDPKTLPPNRRIDGLKSLR